ncbi:MAG: Universal stress protein [Methanoregulaceae archaeon PtaU1.Bin059]|nr:MAG: Universal stress protein [Methanoregulaceae archaeon PtaB.Bin009]OPY39443.1 MAG: Universal stress protein [Methanoregulaceae archaeon PtaU1.Bin059]
MDGYKNTVRLARVNPGIYRLIPPGPTFLQDQLIRLCFNMFERILVPTDFSWYAQRTVRYATEIPGATGVILLHIAEDAGECMTWPSLMEARNAPCTPANALAYAGDALEKAGLSVTYEVAPPKDAGTHAAILACAEQHKADLILIGGKGRGFFKDMLLGSVSRRVIEEAKTHVLVTHFLEQPGHGNEAPDVPVATGRPLFSRILVPVDFSRPTYETIEFLSDVGGYDEIILMHVIASVEDRHDLQKKLQHSMQALSYLQRDLALGGGKIIPLIRFGDTVGEICRMADEERATLILISRFGASDYMKDGSIGSIAEEVTKRARVPVLVRYPGSSLDVQVREVGADEFPRAGEVWAHYRQQHADPSTDRIFGVFVQGDPVSLARCRRFPDGLEVDGVFTLEGFRRRGYARGAVSLLVRECGTEPLYTLSTADMIEFFRSFGFNEIPEKEMPGSIRERYSFALGDLAGADLYPMSRSAKGASEAPAG